MGIYAAPGASIEATVTNVTTGQTGTLGVRIVDGQGATTTARTTSGIVETPTGSGIYTATLTAPTTAGQYSVVWDTGGGAPIYAAEDLTVTSTGVAAATPSGADLTTLAAVRAFLQKKAGDTEQDSIIQSLITRASAAIEAYAGREFHPTTDATRTFNYLGGGRLSLAPYDLRSVTAMRWDTDTSSPTTALTTDYWLDGGTIGGTYQSVMLPNLRTTDTPGVTTRRTVEIRGAWGFNTVPADVAHAAIVTTAIWLRRDVAAFSTTFSIDEQRLERPEALPQAVRGILTPYRLAGVA